MTNEPTTGELIEQLHTFDNVDAVTITIAKAALLFIADRLESQAEENEISRHLIEMQSNVITELTARAESAERERDAAKADFEVIEQDGLCSVCKFESSIPLMECMENCVFKWRGLQPQDGEGV